MNDAPAPPIVGIQPRFPGALNRWGWLMRPVAAERVAALRIATALALLLDIAASLLPHFSTFFAPDALGGRDQYSWRFRPGHHYWSLLRVLPDAWGPQLLVAVWIVAALALLIGYRPLVSGLVCWACAVSFWNINPWIANGGDQLRNSLLFLVALSRSGAVWGVQSVRRHGRAGPVLVPGWPMKALIVQLCAIYFFSGIHKLAYPQWRDGMVMYYVNHDLTWSLVPNLTSLLPVGLHRLSTWITLVWEIGFPFLIAYRRTRTATLVLGVIFHVLTLFTLEVGMFAIYSLVFYVVFVPWERLSGRAHDGGR
jgi:vitamin K-dependent gamma-carboxylase-like protein